MGMIWWETCFRLRSPQFRKKALTSWQCLRASRQGFRLASLSPTQGLAGRARVTSGRLRRAPLRSPWLLLRRSLRQRELPCLTMWPAPLPAYSAPLPVLPRRRWSSSSLTPRSTPSRRWACYNLQRHSHRATRRPFFEFIFVPLSITWAAWWPQLRIKCLNFATSISINFWGNR